ncbi:glycosyltransferase [Sansalvadorimonas sp. 2012CJ34-2]|uniref:Glycosyltransferase n=1 Tax=Parendozoicomonas callyspongiae TaxID=2942213 RepID=A0ABT0PMT4_9GAMM|nr:glycosyltransferase [Sansalvadorimonas sp. 2012CJ34-2]MCL6272047.1 glycosyltransferase [Sansalvadorimonas sp. 2012CJ34-2]
MFERTEIAIVNRSFWPANQVIGEALLRFAESASAKKSVTVITQSSDNLHSLLDNNQRGNGVLFKVCKSLTTSSSSIVIRALEAIYFMLWVAACLIMMRPKKVYVATDPPILVPFIVYIYSRISGSKYYYHLQDIHPEAANIVVPLYGPLYKLLKFIDNITISNASAVITLSDDMSSYLKKRSSSDVATYLVDNPSFEVNSSNYEKSKKRGIVFCGNAGRLQRIPLLISSIRSYLDNGGKAEFTFIGSGIFTQDLELLAKSYPQVSCMGYLPAPEAASVVKQFPWAMLPIDDEVTHYAFPSKSSSYVLSGCQILAICGRETSVSKWIIDNNLGITVNPDEKELVKAFFLLESQLDISLECSEELKNKLSIDYFVDRIINIVCSG